MKNASKIPTSLVPQMTALKGIFFYLIALFICYFWSYFFQWEEIVLFVLSCSVQLYLFGFPLSKDLFQNNE